MTTRYTVQPTPYGNTDNANNNAPWCVVDTQPVIEQYETVTGATMTETKPPPWRKVAFCMKRSHADLIAKALNVDAHPLIVATEQEMWPRSVYDYKKGAVGDV